jgi:hypothetical protein
VLHGARLSFLLLLRTALAKPEAFNMDFLISIKARMEMDETAQRKDSVKLL